KFVFDSFPMIEAASSATTLQIKGFCRRS
ncbi:hypothetical protein CCACVL1_01867, partial [Corchorus capsularis]